MSLDSAWSGGSGFRNRFLLLSLAAFSIFLVLFLRLWYLQVVSHEKYLSLSEKNRIRYIPVAAPRGPIYDRDGKLLVDNRPSFTVSVLRQEVPDRDLLLTRLATYLEVPRESLLEKWEAGKKLPRFRSLSMADDISRDALERILENSVTLPGVFTEVRPLRHYPDGSMAAHLIGYLGEITEGELRQSEGDRQSGDFIGKTGIERRLETMLRGVDGEHLVEVNVAGKELRHLETQEPNQGNSVFLTIRRDLQLAAEAAFGEQAGAVVALDVRTGEVLALVSRPTFNPADFARGISGEQWLTLQNDPRHPMTNKALKGVYPPGSTFKIVTALAALHAGAANPNTTVFCPGKFKLGSREFRCWKKEGHGYVDLKKALRESCDVWFYQVSLGLGIDRLAQTARDLGLGQNLRFDIEGEKVGLIPDQKWKRERLKDKWYNGETIINAIGQGYVTATPMQLAVMMATVANGGTVMRPHVVRKVEAADGTLLMEGKPEVIRRAGFKAADLQQVQRGLVAVVNEPGGTGRLSRVEDPTILVAGKTGTAQVIKQKERIRNEGDVPYKFRDHALFVAYAPAHDPQIAVAVVVEHGMHGGSAAAPIAGAIFSRYFGLTPEPEEAFVQGILPEEPAPGDVLDEAPDEPLDEGAPAAAPVPAPVQAGDLGD